MIRKLLLVVLPLVSLAGWAQEDLDSQTLIKRSLIFYEDVKDSDSTMKAIEDSGGCFKLELKDTKNRYLELAKFVYENGRIENLILLNDPSRKRSVPISSILLRTQSVPSLWSHPDGIFLGFQFETGWGAKLRITGTRMILEEYNE